MPVVLSPKLEELSDAESTSVTAISFIGLARLNFFMLMIDAGLPMLLISLKLIKHELLRRFFSGSPKHFLMNVRKCYLSKSVPLCLINSR